MRTSLILFFLGAIQTLVVVVAFHCPPAAFLPTIATATSRCRFVVTLYAAEGAPQYEKLDAVMGNAETVAEGTVMLHINTENGPLDYKPGHVIALEIEDDMTAATNGKTSEDTVSNGGWMRGPYTISRASEDSLEVLIKVVGKKSKAFADAAPGTPLKFGGKYHVPILDGINQQDTKRVVLISTGVGVGPCIGAIEQALQNEEEEFPPIELYASYRTESDVVCSTYLDKLSTENPQKFHWKPIITSKSGRISATEDNVKVVLPSLPTHPPASSSSEETPSFSLSDTHYHLIGNGQMVNEWKAGLAKAGVPDEKVTVEFYFNFKEPVNEQSIENIANVVGTLAAVISGSKSPVA